ncbi:polysaccharide pyruvyl transferase family protein [Caproiciproducens galactitolivorans]|uniref:polysaccharide pyruvyl transferase family protein n=1 Tax=Caproiciproducens galactitolivorans TaxID=642589 RepID=UPI00240A2376|nr:polysaccharide pyruvyl transferase family protein [Caproiciproducens galactitolivorans]
MIPKGNTLHFINRLDDTNCGDRVVCPLLHYYDYFKQYQIKRHDMRYVDFDSISPTDVVIIGGGGMFDYAEFTNRIINRVLHTGAAVIAWSPGFNTHTEYNITFDTKIEFDRFALITVRDYNNDYGIAYLPDVTCKLPQLRKKYEIRRKYGIARHKDYPIPGLNFDTITNRADLNEIIQFIGESEIVISNSFHMIYWSMLMGKKTICANPFSNKFYSYKYKPQYFEETDDFSDCVNSAPVYDMLDECIVENDAFFEKVKRIVESRLEPDAIAPNTYELVTQAALAEEKFRDTQLLPGDLLVSQLFIDTGDGWSEKSKLVAINNVFGDEWHKVRFDISAFKSIQKIRFDPIESRYCEVEIRSAKSADGQIPLAAEVSMRVDSQDRFLTTDPQYIITSPCKDFIEIEFRLRILTLFEAEQNIKYYSHYMSSEIINRDEQIRQCGAERDNAFAERDNAFAERDNAFAERDNAFAERDNAFAERDNAFAERDRLLQSKSWKITAPLRAVFSFFKRLLKGTK